MPFAPKWFLLDTNFETLPQTGARAPLTPKITDFSSKSLQKVTHKLTQLSSPCSLCNICGELGDPKMAPSFPLNVLPLFLVNLWGEPCSCTFCTFLGVRRCHAARRLHIRRTSGAAGRDGITAEFASAKSFLKAPGGHSICRRPFRS